MASEDLDHDEQDAAEEQAQLGCSDDDVSGDERLGRRGEKRQKQSSGKQQSKQQGSGKGRAKSSKRQDSDAAPKPRGRNKEGAAVWPVAATRQLIDIAGEVLGGQGRMAKAEGKWEAVARGVSTWLKQQQLLASPQPELVGLNAYDGEQCRNKFDMCAGTAEHIVGKHQKKGETGKETTVEDEVELEVEAAAAEWELIDVWLKAFPRHPKWGTQKLLQHATETTTRPASSSALSGAKRRRASSTAAGSTVHSPDNRDASEGGAADEAQSTNKEEQPPRPTKSSLQQQIHFQNMEIMLDYRQQQEHKYEEQRDEKEQQHTSQLIGGIMHTMQQIHQSTMQNMGNMFAGILTLLQQQQQMQMHMQMQGGMPYGAAAGATAGTAAGMPAGMPGPAQCSMHGMPGVGGAAGFSFGSMPPNNGPSRGSGTATGMAGGAADATPPAGNFQHDFFGRTRGRDLGEGARAGGGPPSTAEL